jgi:broad specificity phosphatase PhoE
VETATIVNRQLPEPVSMVADQELREADFSRYLQGVPFWQIPVRRPLWFVHKARRGLVPGDEPTERLGGRILDVARRLARERPGEPAALVSHADPLQAAWVLLDGRPQNEREIYRKQVDRAGMLVVDLDENGRALAVNYEPPPTPPKELEAPAPAASG